MSSNKATDWQETTWGELITLEYGRQLKGEKLEIGPTEVFGTNGPTGSFTNGFHGEGAGIIVGRKGAYRGVVWSEGPYWVIDTAFYVEPKAGTELDRNWIYRALACNDISAMDSGSAIPSTSRGDVYALPVKVPPLAEQQRIAGVLSSIDRKIELNLEMSKTLEEIAAKIFAMKFVEFVGVEEFDESDDGPIPKGWKALPFSDIVEINPKVSIKKGTYAPYIEMSALGRWGTRSSRIDARKFNSGSKFEKGDTLFARITGCIEHGKGAYLDFIQGATAGSTEFLVFRAKEPLTPEAVFLLSRLERVRNHAMANMIGSSGRQRVPAECFDHILIAVPPSLSSWRPEAKAIEALFKKSLGLWQENRTLTSLRDELSPRLVDGQLRVSEDFIPGDGFEDQVETGI